MAMRIDFSCSIVEELRRILTELSDYAGLCLDRFGSLSPDDREDAVHELRKTTKKIRALLRLLSPLLGRGVRRRQIARWRAIAAASATSRDRTVLEQLLKSAYATLLPEADPSTRPWEQLTLCRAAEAAHPPIVDGSSSAALRLLLAAAAADLNCIELAAMDFETLLEGATRTYEKGRRQLRAVVEQVTPEGLHELRKRVKDQLYQLRLFSKLEPQLLGSQLARLEPLSELLGAHHDLTLLRDAIARVRSSFCQLEELPGLDSWVTSKMTDLELESLAIAKTVFSEPPKARARALRTLARRTIACSACSA